MAHDGRLPRRGFASPHGDGSRTLSGRGEKPDPFGDRAGHNRPPGVIPPAAGVAMVRPNAKGTARFGVVGRSRSGFPDRTGLVGPTTATGVRPDPPTTGSRPKGLLKRALALHHGRRDGSGPGYD